MHVRLFTHAHVHSVPTTAPYFLCAELGWGYACDMWSLGCMFLELYTGETLFQVSVRLRVPAWHNGNRQRACVSRSFSCVALRSSLNAALALLINQTHFIEKKTMRTSCLRPSAFCGHLPPLPLSPPSLVRGHSHTHTLTYSSSLPFVLQTHENMEHLAMMEACLGPVPSALVNATRCAGSSFT